MLLINPGYDMVVLPSFSCVSNLVPVSAILVARTVAVVQEANRPLPEHLEDIIIGSHPSLGDEGWDTLRNILHKYTGVFPAPGETVTGRGPTRQLKLMLLDLFGVGHVEQTCIKDMLEGGQIEPSDSPWASPVVLVTKQDGSTRFYINYHQLNTLTVKDTYLLPRIDD